MPPDATPILRILDASLNRAAEGLRVVEDYARFVLDDAYLTEQLKQLRHDLAAGAATIPASDRHASRDTPHDVGTVITMSSESHRPDAWSVCQASLERTKQSLRSLEEYGKVAAPQTAASFESLRYRLYALEAALGRTVDAVERLAAVQLCVLIDGRDSELEFSTLVADLIAAGVGALQLRDKVLPVRELVGRARLLVAATRTSGRTLALINDRPAVAVVVDADGVQIGQEDFTVKDARAVVGPRKLIGVSTHSLHQAQQAVLDGANFIGVGPTFPSTTKQFAEFPGLDLLRQVAAEIRLPAFAIGGINAANVGDVLAAGISRIAVSSAVAAAPSPAVAAQELLSALGSGTVETPPPARV